MTRVKRIFQIWLPLVVIISAFCVLVYVTVQQSYRQGANDPQIQMAEASATLLDDGTSIDSLMPQQKVNIVQNLAPFYVLYDRAGNPASGNGLLNGQLPEIPKGVLATAKQAGENRRTWEPENGVRIAAVIVPYQGGFVLVGRNLREVEAREAQLTILAGVTWILTLGATLALIVFGEIYPPERRK